MQIIDRIILALYTLAITVLTLGIIVLTLQFFSEEFIWTNFMFVISRWETGGIAVIFLLMSLRLLKVSLTRSRASQNDEAVIIHTAIGDVRIAVIAIKNLVEKVIRSINGIRDVKIYIIVERRQQNQLENTNVRIESKIVVSPESDVIRISDQIQQMVKEKIKTTIGIEVDEIDVLVEDISNAGIQKQRVV